LSNPHIQSRDCVETAAKYAAEYVSTVDDREIAPTKDALSGLSKFDEPLPDGPSAPDAVLQMLNEYGAPATTATTTGRFFGLVMGGTLPAALGARIITSAWDQAVFNDAISAVGVKLEQVAQRWLLEVLGLPDTCSLSFVTGATMGNFTCLAAARHAIFERQGWDVNEQGMAGAPHIRIVASEQIHVTVLKALTLLGFGKASIEWVKCDDQGRMDLASLPSLDPHTIVLTQAGNVNSGASDPIGAVANRANGAWVHVDGAFGLWAAAAPTLKLQLEGYEQADSWVTDGHKWLNTPYDCGIAICRHPQALHAAMATQAPYLKTGGTAAPKDMAPEFSRSARGTEVWAALRSLGKAGLAEMFETCCGHARTLANGLRELGFDILNDVVLNQVVASLPNQEDVLEALAANVRESGEAWFGPTNWRGRKAVRFSVSNWTTSKEDIVRTLNAIKRVMEECRSS